MNDAIVLSTIIFLLVKGMVHNITLWFFGGLLSLCGGMILSYFSHQRAQRGYCARIIKAYTVLMRSVPLYVQLLYVYFVVPALVGVNLPPWSAALIAIVLCVTAYCTEVIRGAINAISPNQWEAASVLGYTNVQTMRYIIMPQVIRQVLPSLINLSEELIKSTAIVSVVGVMDITRTGMNIIARTMNPELVYSLIALMYVLVSLTIQSILPRIVRSYAA